MNLLLCNLFLFAGISVVKFDELNCIRLKMMQPEPYVNYNCSAFYSPLVETMFVKQGVWAPPSNDPIPSMSPLDQPCMPLEPPPDVGESTVAPQEAPTPAPEPTPPPTNESTVDPEVAPQEAPTPPPTNESVADKGAAPEEPLPPQAPPAETQQNVSDAGPEADDECDDYYDTEDEKPADEPAPPANVSDAGAEADDDADDEDDNDSEQPAPPTTPPPPPPARPGFVYGFVNATVQYVRGNLVSTAFFVKDGVVFLCNLNRERVRIMWDWIRWGLEWLWWGLKGLLWTGPAVLFQYCRRRRPPPVVPPPPRQVSQARTALHDNMRRIITATASNPHSPCGHDTPQLAFTLDRLETFAIDAADDTWAACETEYLGVSTSPLAHCLLDRQFVVVTRHLLLYFGSAYVTRP